jgi:hypothetical protein
VQVTVLGQNLVPPTPAVNFPPGGTKSLIGPVGGGGVSVGVLSVSATGDPSGNTQSSASVLDAGVPTVLTAAALTSNCSASPTTAGGSSVLTSAVGPGGTPLNVTPAPNTSVPLLVGSLNLNEQQNPSANSIRVRAAHVASPAADVILSESDCGASLIGAATATAASATSASAASASAASGSSAAMPTLAG